MFPTYNTKKLKYTVCRASTKVKCREKSPAQKKGCPIYSIRHSLSARHMSANERRPPLLYEWWWRHYFRAGNIVTLLSPVYLISSCFWVVATRHEPSLLLATRYGSGVLDIYGSKLVSLTLIVNSLFHLLLVLLVFYTVDIKHVGGRCTAVHTSVCSRNYNPFIHPVLRLLCDCVISKNVVAVTLAFANIVPFFVFSISFSVQAGKSKGSL